MTRPSTATQEEMRRHNLGTLLRLVHVHGATSRAELTARTGLNRSTVKDLVGELAALGLVHESAPISTGAAGRPSIAVAPARDRIYVIAVDIRVDEVAVARIGLGGVVLGRRSVRLAGTDHEVTRVLDRVAAMIDDLVGAAADAQCAGIGISVCGLVSAGTGHVRFAPNLGWVDVPLRDLLSSRLGGSLPILVGNDGSLGALAEHVRGAGVGTTDLVYLSGAVGLGGGIILSGRLIGGADGYAGEVGHICINPDGRRCRCGRRGCWETEVGEEAVIQAAGPGVSSLSEVFRAYRAGEPAARTGLDRIGRWFGTGVANLVNVLNPQLVIFGGATHELFGLIHSSIERALAAALVAPLEHVRLSPSGLGADSALVGAAEVAFEELLTDPVPAASAPSGNRWDQLLERTFPARSKTT